MKPPRRDPATAAQRQGFRRGAARALASAERKNRAAWAKRKTTSRTAKWRYLTASAPPVSEFVKIPGIEEGAGYAG